jgi:copper chaperone CopZ
MKLHSLLLSGLLVLLSPIALHAEEITITVKGMVCSFCAQGLKKTFSRNGSVSTVEVDLDKKIVSVTTKDGAILSDEELTKIVNDAGYDIAKIARSEGV